MDTHDTEDVPCSEPEAASYSRLESVLNAAIRASLEVATDGIIAHNQRQLSGILDQANAVITDRCKEAMASLTDSLMTLMKQMRDQYDSKFSGLLVQLRDQHDSKYSALAADVHSLQTTMASSSSMQIRLSEIESMLTAKSQVQELLSMAAPDRASIPCKFYQSGVCKLGTACRFQHDHIRWTEAEPVLPQAAPQPGEREEKSDEAFHDIPLEEEQYSVLEGLLDQLADDGFPDALNGKLVSISGLRSATELNGQIGRLMSVDRAKKRGGVVFASQCQKSIKFVNLQFPARCHRCGEEVSDLQGCTCRV